MKNFIKANYNMYPNKIYKKNNIYFFFSENEKIIIIKTNKDNKYLDNLVKISNQIYNNGILVSTFILNNNNEYYTKKDNDYIVLLKYNDVNVDDLNIKDIIKYNINDELNLEKLDLVKEMEKKIDTLESEMTEYNKEYPIIQESLNYFIGLSENAIQMLKNININNNSLAHNIEVDKFNIYELNNPFNLIVSNKMYDVALYFKYKFYNDYIDYDELYNILINNKKEDLICFYALMLYQKEYFDDVKQVLLNKKDEKTLLNYINNINKYKELLKYIKNSLHNINEILELEWIDK